MRIEHSGIYAGLDGGAHEFEFDARQHGRENAAVPADGIAYDVLFLMSQNHDTRARLHTKQPRNAGSQTRCDPIQHENGGNFLAALDCRQHTSAHLTAGAQLLEAKFPLDALEPNPFAEPDDVQTIRAHVAGWRTGVFVHYSRIESFIGNASACSTGCFPSMQRCEERTHSTRRISLVERTRSV